MGRVSWGIIRDYAGRTVLDGLTTRLFGTSRGPDYVLINNQIATPLELLHSQHPGISLPPVWLLGHSQWARATVL
jgi:hypothetical protein